MKITNDIRSELAAKLMVKAMEKHGLAFYDRLKAITSGLEAAHREHIKALMPEVPPKRYADLIQAGVLTATARAASEVYYPKRDPKNNSLRASTTYGTRCYVNAKDILTDRKVSEISRALSASRAWAGLRGEMSMDCTSGKLKFILSLKFSETLPSHKYQEYVHFHNLEPERVGDLDPAEKAHLMRLAPLYAELQKLMDDLEKTFIAGLGYHSEVLDLLAACNTRKQLEDLFPEAAKLLPPPAPKRQAVAPTELAAKVRQRLEQGVPA